MREEGIIVGGQAVLEGVMMRSPGAYAVAVRRPDGQIVSQQERVENLAARYRALKLPIVRGGGVLIQSMVLGIRALNFSAGVALTEQPQADPLQSSPTGLQPASGKRFATAITILPALAFNILIFIFLPLLLTNLLFLLFQDKQRAVAGAGETGALLDLIKFYLHPVRPSVIFNLVDGLIRIGLFLGFIAGISRLKDIKRVFEYHGAEHKVVYAWESGEPLTVESARSKPRRHPRCGTSFLMVVMLVSMGVFSLIKFEALTLNFAARLLLIPVVAGISYEVIRLSTRSSKRAGDGARTTGLSNGLFALITAPGLWLQDITTREPSDDQLEVAIYALKESLRLERPTATDAMAAD